MVVVLTIITVKYNWYINIYILAIHQCIVPILTNVRLLLVINVYLKCRPKKGVNIHSNKRLP